MDKLNKEELEELKQMILQYHGYENKKIYSEIMRDYRIKYIYNESKVEGNMTPEEQLGIGVVYDYIQHFDFNKDYFNIFTTSLLIHQKMYSKCVGGDFGGNLRDTQAILKGTNIEVMDAESAKKYFNSFIATSNEIFLPLENKDIIGYIENCVYTITELIKAQPFADGNKRTFRSLLNLLLKKISLPPIYIDFKDRKLYKDLLIDAMNNNYEGITIFYYNKILEAIIGFDSDAIDYENRNQKTLKLINDIRNIG